MAYYADLTEYSYGRTAPDKNVLNIGWLSGDHDYPKGEVSDKDFLNFIKFLIKTPKNLYRGWHSCEFCINAGLDFRWGEAYYDRPCGNGEIMVKSISGKIYVAPTLICHYIEVHSYLPPKVFIDAVLYDAPYISVAQMNKYLYKKILDKSNV